MRVVLLLIHLDHEPDVGRQLLAKVFLRGRHSIRPVVLLLSLPCSPTYR